MRQCVSGLRSRRPVAPRPSHWCVDVLYWILLLVTGTIVVLHGTACSSPDCLLQATLCDALSPSAFHAVATLVAKTAGAPASSSGVAGCECFD